MSTGTKIVVIVLCISLCGGGIVVNSKERAKDSAPRGQIAPVINRQPQHTIWLRV